MNLTQHLSHDQRQIKHQHKQKTVLILLDTIETKLHESQMLFNDQITKLWHHQCVLEIDQKLNQTMIDLIERHLLIITDKIQCMYHFRKNIMNHLYITNSKQNDLYTSNVRRFDSLDPRLNKVEVFSVDTDSDRTDIPNPSRNSEANFSRIVSVRNGFVFF